MSIQWGDVATWVAGLSTTTAVGFAAIQLQMLRSQSARDREIELRGVAVSWRAPRVPSGPGSDGLAEWTYEFVAHNPGRLPIRSVSVTINVPVPVRRKHFDGHIGEPTMSLGLVAPVIVGSDRRTWRRHLLIPYAERGRLPETVAHISFTTMDGTRITNEWSGPDDTETDGAAALE